MRHKIKNTLCKKLQFATISQQHKTKAVLCTKNNNAKSLYQFLTTSFTKSFSSNED
ncbi:4730_t:CDS:2 [Dentiscutata heterogama]|uniref:4730_t:CDS:1 n=1 Tax=Dentiscutata heterogama TaxID=1316150 RepID=A0ACA9KR72_9GLOM|nr:4730_t:CDS:2 [Dentiscutata heterogama]